MTRFQLLRLLLPLVILLLSAAVVGALVATRPETQSEPAREPVRSVGAMAVNPAPHSPVVRLYGRLESPSRTRLNAALTADVLAVPVRDGQTFARGELLVRLDDADARLAVRQREADVAELEAQLRAERARHRYDRQAVDDEQRLLELARREVARQEDLAARELSSAAAVDAARRELARQELALTLREETVATFEARIGALEARLERARAALDTARRDLARTRISAPFDGRAASVEVAAGGRVRPGDALLTVYDTADLEVRATLPAAHVARVREALAEGRALEAVARVDGRALQVRLVRLAGLTVAGAAGVEAIFQVQGGEPRVALGRFASVSLRLPPVAGSIAVPFQALYGIDRLYRVQDGRLAAVSVERLGEAPGPDGTPRALVRSDALRAGERIVTTQLPEATDGLRVQIVEDR